ncbi:YheC/YheD family endospore coat-associated protein [Caldalkalibacillus mannanilyticus]|uniref:YheC/YheD family endospore coat-associated protein n=1 Tax=Caldalkalibacillus mannanilyticus TaxID=1418 RepID=UPI00046834B9|nr:YheC/YheD family protein [Caldalkalibacillus mannanilyticus]
MKRTHLGILVRFNSKLNPPFSDQLFFKVISVYCQKKGMVVTVFSPPSILWKERKVLGYQYNTQSKEWEKGAYPIPSVLYDRIAYRNMSQVKEYHAKIKKLQLEENPIILARGLPGKWKVYNMLKNHPIISAFLPETVEYTAYSSWQSKMKEYQSLIFKPASGSNGKGVVKISYFKAKFYVKGRSPTNQPFSKMFDSYEKCQRWLNTFIGRRRYVIQPYLSLSTLLTDEPFDIRILIQKNEHGEWEETGRAVRLGQKNGITSNLDGGGTAVEVSSFLEEHFTEEQVESINKQIETIVAHIPTAIEEKHGALIELGLDIGVDQEGQVWILEANSKPGRKSFYVSKNKEAYIKSLLAPAKYAEHVISQFGGRILV